MATVLSILEATASELGIGVPSAYNEDRQLLFLLYSVNREIRASRAFPQQKRTHTITFTAARAKYPLPEDFYAGLLSTQYDRTSSRPLIGPLSDGAWNYRLYDVGGSDSEYAVRVFGWDNLQASATAGGQLEVDPAPGATDTIGFDYITKTTLLPPAWVALTAVTLNHYRHANGNIYQATVAGTTGSTPPSHTSSTATDGTVTWTYISAPKETASVDGDLCLFDDDILIEGLKWKYREAKGQDWGPHKAAFDSMLSNAVARWHGSRVGRMDLHEGVRRGRYAFDRGGWSL